MLISILGLIGLAVTLYAINVEKNAVAAKRALCDINEHISCTLVLTSKYAKMMGLIFKLPYKHPLNLPNTYYGLIFYIIIILYPVYPFTLIPFREVLFLVASSFSLLSCCGLAYILYVYLKDFCIVCVATYIVNIFIFYQALKENAIVG